MRLAAPAFLAVILAAGTAAAHAKLVAPLTPRVDSDAIKSDPPCGNVPRGAAPVVTYTEGQQNINVGFKETVDHTGCFVVTLLRTGDTVAQVLQTKEDGVNTIPAGGRSESITVNLPAGVTCNRCTIQLRQVMSGTQSCDAGTFNASTYLSCADIRITYADGGVPPDDTPPPDAGTDAGGGSAGSAGTAGTGTGGTTGGGTTGGSTAPRDAGASAGGDEARPSFKANDAGGCAMQGGTAAAGAGAAWLVVGLAAFVARRRRTRG